MTLMRTTLSLSLLLALIPLTAEASEDFPKVAVGRDFACAIKPTDSNTLYCWGSGQYGQIGNGSSGDNNNDHITPTSTGLSGVLAVAAGWNHACAITSAGALYCWGKNDYGQIGDGTTTMRPSPTLIVASGVTAITTGAYHTCAVTAAPTGLKCWGRNDDGQLGDNTTVGKLVPTAVGNGHSSGFDLKRPSAGERNTCATGWYQDPVNTFNVFRSVYCWGANDDYQLHSSLPSQKYPLNQLRPSGQSGELRTYAGYAATCSKYDNSGNVYCRGTMGGLFLNTSGTTVGLVTGVAGFHLGKHGGSGGPSLATSQHVCTIVAVPVRSISITTVRCKGLREHCRLGDLGSGGSCSSSIETSWKDVMAVNTITDIAIGSMTTCLVDTAGVMCWGDNSFGQLGVGDYVEYNYPARTMLY